MKPCAVAPSYGLPDGLDASTVLPKVRLNVVGAVCLAAIHKEAWQRRVPVHARTKCQTPDYGLGQPDWICNHTQRTLEEALRSYPANDRGHRVLAKNVGKTIDADRDALPYNPTCNRLRISRSGVRVAKPAPVHSVTGSTPQHACGRRSATGDGLFTRKPGPDHRRSGNTHSPRSSLPRRALFAKRHPGLKAVTGCLAQPVHVPIRQPAQWHTEHGG